MFFPFPPDPPDVHEARGGNSHPLSSARSWRPGTWRYQSFPRFSIGTAGFQTRVCLIFLFSFRPLSYLHLPALLSIMPSSSPRGQGGPKKSATEVHVSLLKKRPLRFLRIPCLWGGKHRTSICPTEQTTTTTTNMVTSCGGTNFKPRKGKRQYRVPSIGHRWTEFRWQAQRRKISVDMTERHYMTLIKQPCGYCGKRQPDTKYTNSNCRYH